MGLESDEGDCRPSKRARISAVRGSPRSSQKGASWQEASMAGKTAANGVKKPTAPETCGPKGQIRKVEFIRLITQALYGLGYSDAASRLEEESGIPLQDEDVASFRKGVLAGNWNRCAEMLSSLEIPGEETVRAAKFLLFEQKFMEALEADDTAKALKVLRYELSPLKSHTKRLHQLAAWVMCSSPKDFLSRSNWGGSGVESRIKTLREIQKLLPPNLMIPEERLEALVEQAVSVQQEKCKYHNLGNEMISLFEDHTCGKELIPTVTTQVLKAHTDEVWYVQFSHDGKRLASASKDNSVIIWEILNAEDAAIAHVLTGHSLPLSFVTWSPDDSLLLTCGNDKLIKLWDTNTGACIRTYQKHLEAVTACAWYPDSKGFVSGGLDKHIIVWDLEGNELESWKGSKNINDLALSNDGQRMVSCSCSKGSLQSPSSNENRIRIYRFSDKSEQNIEERDSITSLCMSQDSRFLLVNLSSQDIHLWDISGTETPKGPACTYRGHKQGRYVIRSCFGGQDQAFVVSGSEDSQVYIWLRRSGELVAVLPGHSGTVNAVSWNPANPHMFASASDDNTIRIWGLPKNKQKKQEANSAFGNGVDHSLHARVANGTS